MGTMTILRSTYPRLTRQFRRPTDVLGRIGDHMLFYVQGAGRGAARGDAFPPRDHPADRRDLHGCGHVGDDRRHRGDRRVPDPGRRRHAGGAGLLARWATSASRRLTGFLAAFINVRISAPVVAGIGLAATFGAGVTAQLGAMRINEEIDALESMAIRPVEYLVSHADRRGDDRDHPAVLDRGDPVVRGLASSPPWCCSGSPVGCMTTTSTRS